MGLGGGMGRMTKLQSTHDEATKFEIDAFMRELKQEDDNLVDVDELNKEEKDHIGDNVEELEDFLVNKMRADQTYKDWEDDEDNEREDMGDLDDMIDDEEKEEKLFNNAKGKMLINFDEIEEIKRELAQEKEKEEKDKEKESQNQWNI